MEASALGASSNKCMSWTQSVHTVSDSVLLLLEFFPAVLFNRTVIGSVVISLVLMTHDKNSVFQFPLWYHHGREVFFGKSYLRSVSSWKRNKENQSESGFQQFPPWTGC
jgi:hypothetical protein